jgi:hypothetical protein
VLSVVRRYIPIAYVSIRQHTSAYVSIRQHTSAYVSILQHQYTSAYVSIRQHTSAYVSIRAYIPNRQPPVLAAHPPPLPFITIPSILGVGVVLGAYREVCSVAASAYVSIRQHTQVRIEVCSVAASAYVSIRQHTSAYVGAYRGV